MGVPVLRQPIIHHSYANILQCYDTLIASYISAYNQPYHWLFCEHWGFHYHSYKEFHYQHLRCRYPLWNMLRDIYQVRKTIYYQMDLESLCRDRLANQDNYLFLIADEYDLAWTPEYGTMHHPHFLTVSAYDEAARQVMIHDWWPVPYEGHIPFDLLQASFQASGSHVFELSEPKLVMTAELIRQLISNCYIIMRGEERDGSYSGLIGLEKFKLDLIMLGDEALDYVHDWFHMLKEIINAKYVFLEFMVYVAQASDLPIKLNVTAELIRTLEMTIGAWFSFRNGLMTDKLKNTYQTELAVRRLQRVIDFETKCAAFMVELAQ